MPPGRRYLVLIFSPAQPLRRGVRVFLHPALELTDAPLAGFLPAGGETERSFFYTPTALGATRVDEQLLSH